MRLVSAPKVESLRETSFATMRSAPLRESLACALKRRSLVSAANPTTTRPPFWEQSEARMSLVSTSSMESRCSWAFLSLWSAGAAGV